ncbi:uncharacterized protein LOC115750376 [Rhodamnia argentea]|uniref:Uncharacterized protein LOC115750376 n=1 Tax=Rhodamnia argentea TaxID=178133 RepID=A0A8B8QAI9_9MYRT|nr:uncharacterized protein LOC115750376 [Rhodamnia argentea]
MAASSSAWVLSAKGVAVSAAVLSAALAMKLSAPSISELARVQIPLLWLSLLSWLEPPYIYLVVNGIIATIVASFKLQGNCHEVEEGEEARVISAAESSGDRGYVFVLPPDGVVCPSPWKNVVYEESGAAGVSEAERAERLVAEGGGGDGHGDRVEEEEEDEEFVISRSTWTPAARRTNSPEVSAERLPAPEKPLVSSRFVHRRPSKASPEALGVIKLKRQETLENAWKAITDGRAMPLARRRLSKSETWENRGHPMDPLDQPRPAMRKSDTLKDRTNQLPTSPPSPAGKEASPSQDELNRRVEAFIRKFNEEMRLQRQESLNQCKAMMNRGS